MNMTPFHLAEGHLLVTGASGGLGRATAVLASSMGARIILSGRDLGRLEETKDMLAGSDHTVAPCDLSDLGAVPAWMRELAKSHGSLNGVVHAAGMQMIRPLKILDDVFLRQTMNINLGAAVALARGFRHRAVCGGGGSVVLISSVMALAGQAGQVAYCASKGALTSACRALAIELAREKIRVNCIAPGLVNTPMAERLKDSLSPAHFDAVASMHPLGFGEPADVAAAAVFLLSPASRWITGTTLIVDGGYTAQ